MDRFGQKVFGMKKRVWLLCLLLTAAGLITACSPKRADIENEEQPSVQETADMKNAEDTGKNNGDSAMKELEYIPEGYERPAKQQGTLEKLTYHTWESFTYEEHAQQLEKEAWVYVPYGYDKDEKYNIMYLSHGGWSDETTIMGTDKILGLLRM